MLTIQQNGSGAAGEAIPICVATNDLARHVETVRLPKIMIVDDEPVNLKVTKGYLEIAGYQDFTITDDDAHAVELIQRVAPDIVLLDVMMPNVSGLEILAQVRAEETTASLPILILTASTDRETKLKALELGATDFLAKPVDPSELIPRVRNALVVKAHQDHLASYAEHLEQQVRARTAELSLSRREVIECLALAGEYRDAQTGKHVVRVGRFAAAISRALGLPAEQVELVEQAAKLHDVGKIGIPDHILRKSGSLSADEFEVMKRHCVLGQQILQRMHHEDIEQLQTVRKHRVHIARHRSSQLVELAATVALTHHEWWNGQGYPHGLKGEQIPLVGRITALADVFDALGSARPYKPAFSTEKCLSMIADGSGSQFDPRLVRVFLGITDQLIQISEELADSAVFHDSQAVWI